MLNTYFPTESMYMIFNRVLPSVTDGNCQSIQPFIHPSIYCFDPSMHQPSIHHFDKPSSTTHQYPIIHPSIQPSTIHPITTHPLTYQSNHPSTHPSVSRNAIKCRKVRMMFNNTAVIQKMNLD